MPLQASEMLLWNSRTEFLIYLVEYHSKLQDKQICVIKSLNVSVKNEMSPKNYWRHQLP